MDILAALYWTKDNIAAFGGDPSRVTIVGHDTGAALANLVLISKSGKGNVHLHYYSILLLSKFHIICVEYNCFILILSKTSVYKKVKVKWILLYMYSTYTLIY